jgi:transposase-like protein
MSPELVDTHTAAAHFGISPDLISKWRHRHKVAPHGLVPGRGRGGLVPLYRLVDLEPLVREYRERAARRADKQCPGLP